MVVTLIGAQLVAEFDLLVRRDGGQVVLLAEDETVIRVGYRPGGAGPDCRDDVCVLPQQELGLLMTETMRRRGSSAELVVEVLA